MTLLTVYANSNAVDGALVEWVNPTYVYSDDGVNFATRAGTTKNIWYGNLFGFDLSALPDGSTINSVTIEAEWKNSAADSAGPEFLVGAKSNNAEVGVGTTDTTGLTTFEVTSYSPTGLTAAQLKATGASGFWAILRFRRSDNTVHTASVDFVRITVNYTTGYIMPVTPAEIVHTGLAVGLLATRLLAAAVGAFALTSPSVTLTYTIPPAVSLAASANIAASGEASTALLTAPGGKTFLAGRIQDDENPADSVDLATGNYTELEWAVKLTAAAPANTTYQFRVTLNGVPLDTYTATPLLTNSSARVLSVTPASFALTSQAVSLERGARLDAQPGAFVETSPSVTLRYNRRLPITLANFAITSQNVSLRATRRLALDARAYTLAGQVVNLRQSHLPLSVTPAAYSLTSQNTALRIARTLPISPATFVLTPQTVTLTYSGDVLVHRTLTVDTTSFTLVGLSATFPVGREIGVTPAAFSLTGQAVNLKYSRRFPLVVRSYTLAGQAVSLEYGRRLPITPGAFSLSGLSVSLERGRFLSLSPGTFIHTGNAVTLIRHARLSVSPAAYLLTSQNVALIRIGSYSLPVTPRTFSLTGQAVNLKYGRRFSITPAAFTLAGQPLSLERATLVLLNAGAFSLTGQDITLNYSGAVLPVTPDNRTYRIEPESRILWVKPENREYTIPAENRTENL